MRLFVAIALPEDVRRELSAARDAVRRELRGKQVAWTRDENFHITLKFLGEVADGEVDRICRRIGQGPLTDAFRLRLGGVSSLPPRGPARVIVADIAGDLEIAGNLAGRIDRICNEVGVPLERRKFNPHITLGRVKEKIAWKRNREASEGLAFDVEEIHVMRSEVGKDGSVYSTIARARLGRGTEKAKSPGTLTIKTGTLPLFRRT
ncbi:MAG TPA: RNA 2',3'-cyclic phosphodiesterase [Tepidisphaeraceae bacterium]|nr:RNA 2',3'-cyclic phosphodiesterase [Tepidisphaeraceae bacterium]